MSRSVDTTVRDDGDMHRYRTEVPNIVFRLGLTPFELALYCLLKQTAGDSGECWKSTATLAKETGMSAGMVSKAKEGLQNARAELGNKPLIHVREQDNVNGGRARHFITLTDVWPENMDACRRPAQATNAAPSSPHEQAVTSSPHERQVHHMNLQVHTVNVTSSPHELNKELLIIKTKEEELIKNNTECVREDAPLVAVNAPLVLLDLVPVAEAVIAAEPYPADMAAYWAAYPALGRSRGSKSETLTAWRRMTQKQRTDAAAGLAEALKSDTFLGWPPSPQRWLKEKRWEVFLEGLTEKPETQAQAAQARSGSKAPQSTTIESSREQTLRWLTASAAPKLTGETA